MYKISSYELFWVLTLMSIGMTVLITIQPAIQYAGNYAWLSVLIAGVAATLITYQATLLARAYQGKTFVQLCESLLGKWLAKLVILNYLIMWTSVTAIILRMASELIYEYILYKTPLIVIISCLSVLIFYGVHLGIEVLSRSATIFGPLVLLSIIVTIVFNIQNVEVAHVQPSFVNIQIKPLLEGALTPVALLGESVIIIALTAFIKDIKMSQGAFMGAIIITALGLTLVTFMVVAVLGVPFAVNQIFPYFTMVRKISLFNILQRLDALAIVVWLMSVYFKMTLYTYCFSHVMKDAFRLKNRSLIAFFFVLVVTILSLIPNNYLTDEYLYRTTYWIRYALPVNMVGIPFLLLMIHWIKSRMNGSRQKQQDQETVSS
ncbi:GerAB/ArcD/ProY family transporter [Alkalihalobacillus sp. 1P02AB]|uniref:GerAB/ArcD/ProY family transporter n=1 Tax=Alkalihalobacillus sp. 1P02AB TaxID=3132260 RepID=UPI0039A59A45